MNKSTVTTLIAPPAPSASPGGWSSNDFSLAEIEKKPDAPAPDYLLASQALPYSYLWSSPELAKALKASPEEFLTDRFALTRFDANDEYYLFRDSGSPVLAVAHLDSVASPAHLKYDLSKDGSPCIFSPVLDDRLGVFIVTYALPFMGLNVDVLLTTGEETGKSTAASFITDKKYNWIVEFDRKGEDVVMYSYETPFYKELLQLFGFKVGVGSNTDICYLQRLEAFAWNIGIGYHDYHSAAAYANLSETARNLQRFAKFFLSFEDVHLPHKKQISYTRYSYPATTAPLPSGRYVSEESWVVQRHAGPALYAGNSSWGEIETAEPSFRGSGHYPGKKERRKLRKKYGDVTWLCDCAADFEHRLYDCYRCDYCGVLAENALALTASIKTAAPKVALDGADADYFGLRLGQSIRIPPTDNMPPVTNRENLLNVFRTSFLGAYEVDTFGLLDHLECCIAMLDALKTAVGFYRGLNWLLINQESVLKITNRSPAVLSNVLTMLALNCYGPSLSAILDYGGLYVDPADFQAFEAYKELASYLTDDVPIGHGFRVEKGAPNWRTLGLVLRWASNLGDARLSTYDYSQILRVMPYYPSLEYLASEVLPIPVQNSILDFRVFDDADRWEEAGLELPGSTMAMMFVKEYDRVYGSFLQTPDCSKFRSDYRFFQKEVMVAITAEMSATGLSVVPLSLFTNIIQRCIAQGKDYELKRSAKNVQPGLGDDQGNVGGGARS